MKRVKIKGLTDPDKNSVFINSRYYTVNLGNGIKKQFVNKAEAVKFVNEVSKFLTYKLHECNELYISAFTYYRRAWFYFDNDKVTTSNLGELYQQDRNCNYYLTAANETFEILYKRANWANGNHFVFVHFNNILENLEAVARVLLDLYATKSAGAVLYELEILRNKIIYCKRTINNYTIELENSFKDSEVISERILKIV